MSPYQSPIFLNYIIWMGITPRTNPPAPTGVGSKTSGRLGLTSAGPTFNFDGPSLSRCSNGGIGRRAGFRFQWPQGCGGSSPLSSTKTKRFPVLFWQTVSPFLKINTHSPTLLTTFGLPKKNREPFGNPFLSTRELSSNLFDLNPALNLLL